jgi:hypothetical protein
MREDERLLAEQTIHQTNIVQTDNVCTVFGTAMFVQHATKQTLGERLASAA